MVLKGHTSEIEFCLTLPISCLFNQAFDNVMETTTVVEGEAFNYSLGAAAPEIPYNITLTIFTSTRKFDRVFCNLCTAATPPQKNRRGE